MALMAPPFPAPSRPSNTTQTFSPSRLTHSWSLTSSTWSFASCGLALRHGSSLRGELRRGRASSPRPSRRRDRLDLLHLLPAAAEGAVELDHRDELVSHRVREIELRLEQPPLRVEHLEVAR